MDVQNELNSQNNKAAPTLARRLILFLTISAAGLIADLWTKSYMFEELGLPHETIGVDWWIIENFFGFQTAVNQGALFGMGQGGSSIFALFSVIALRQFYFGLSAAKPGKAYS